MDYIYSLDAWLLEESLCVCPDDGTGTRYPICSAVEAATCTADLWEGESVSTSRRDQRSVTENRDDDLKERVTNVRHKRELGYARTDLVKVVHLKLTSGHLFFKFQTIVSLFNTNYRLNGFILSRVSLYYTYDLFAVTSQHVNVKVVVQSAAFL